MEDALNLLRTSVDDQEFLRLTRTVLRITQNLLNDPDSAKFRTVRAACKYVQKPGVAQLLEAIGFKLKGEEYILEPEHDSSLMQKKAQIITSRKEVGTVMGWDVPSSSLKFSLVQDKGKFGDIFVGRMDDRDVMVKVVQPDCNQESKCAFDRELDILSKISHPHIVQLLAVTLTSEPISLILEHIPRCLLDVLHSSEVSEKEVLCFGQQLASAMLYLHQKDILHCDLAARNLLLGNDNQLRLSEFGLSRCADTLSCQLPSSATHLLNTRWTAPETLKDLTFSKHSDIWSFGIVLYELLTGGSVPYATLSNTEVLSKVESGVRLSQPQGCPEELYHVMQLCWAQRPTDRPRFSEVLKTHLEPLVAKLASEATPSSTPVEEGEHKSLHSKPSKKLKVKELSYQSVLGKGGGLVRVYTALVSPLQQRVVVVCSRKSSVGEVIGTALAKCGKQDQDTKNHKMVLVSGPTSGSPAHYLDLEDKIISIKSGAPPTAMFVLCVNMPGQAPLEILDSIRQNPAYGSAFSLNTRGYLVRKEKNQGHRSWCVLDGSTLFCYKEEEDEGMKQFESYLDFKDCTVELSSKGKSHVFKVTTTEGAQYLFLATNKDDMLQWVESITSSKTLDPSPLLLHATGGAVIHTGFMTCQEFACESVEGVGGPLKPLLQSKISDADFSGTFAAIDYGKHWTVLRSSGLVQCLVKGRPETLFNLADCQRVKVNNPKEMKEGVDYCIEVESAESRFVLRADLPTDHCDWVLAVEQILKKLDHSKLLQGHRKRESGYVALKRLLLTGAGQQLNNGRTSQLYCFPRIFDDMEDIYDPPKVVNAPPPKEHAGPRSELLQRTRTPRGKENSPLREHSTSEDNIVPLPPKDYLPPPLPPRKEAPPPLPPKARSIVVPRPTSTISSSSCSDADDDYVMMQSSARSSVPASPLSAHLSPTPRSHSVSQSSTQPITIPNRRSSKRSILLRGDSESSSPPINSSLRSLHEGAELVSVEVRKHSFSRSSSMCRQNSNQSLGSSYGNMMRQVSISSSNSENPPLPPRNGEKKSSGYASPVSPYGGGGGGGRLPQSNTMSGISSHVPMFGGEDSSRSEGMTVTELQQYRMNGKVPISKADSMPRQMASSYVSEGYGSNHSSSEDLEQLPSGWERGYCENNSSYFYFNSHTGVSTWSLQEVLGQAQKTVPEEKPGVGWKTARTEDGRMYYYHEGSRQTTWNIQETLATV